MRIGYGYDIHRFAEDRALILGGVHIPFEKGLLGHSDADVLLHALMDALLGAAGLGDIGGLFPDTDDRYKDADSSDLVRHVMRLVLGEGFAVGNIDCTVIAEEPRLAPHVERMKANIAKYISVGQGSVNIKATTEEGLGLAGRGIAASCVCLLL